MIRKKYKNVYCQKFCVTGKHKNDFILKKPYYNFTVSFFTDVIAKATEIYSQNILMIKSTFFTKIYMKKMGMMVSICKQLLMKITAVKTIMIVSNYREYQTNNKKQ